KHPLGTKLGTVPLGSLGLNRIESGRTTQETDGLRYTSHPLGPFCAVLFWICFTGRLESQKQAGPGHPCHASILGALAVQRRLPTLFHSEYRARQNLVKQATLALLLRGFRRLD